MQQPVEHSTRAVAANAASDGSARTVVMTLIGEFDIYSSPRLGTAFARLHDVSNVVLDLSEMRYLDSTAVTEFIRLHNARKAKGFERETVVISGDPVRRIFNILHLADVFKLVERLDDAVAQRNTVIDLDFVAS